MGRGKSDSNTTVPARGQASKLLQQAEYVDFQPLSSFPTQGVEGSKFGTLIGGDLPPTKMAVRLPFTKPQRSVIVTLTEDGELLVTEQLVFSPHKEFARIHYRGKDMNAAREHALTVEKAAKADPQTKFYKSDNYVPPTVNNFEAQIASQVLEDNFLVAQKFSKGIKAGEDKAQLIKKLVSDAGYTRAQSA